MRKLKYLIVACIIFSAHQLLAHPNGKLIEDWLVLGSFKCDTIDQALDITFVENEPHIYPDEGIVDHPSGDRWKRYSVNNNGQLDFLKLKLSYSTFCVVYTAVYIYSPIEKNIKLLVGSDDGIGMWMNGNLIHHNVKFRGLNRAEDIVPARLSPGWNRLLTKVFTGSGQFAVIAEIVNQNDSFPEDLVFSCNKPDTFKPKGVSSYPFLSGISLGNSYISNESKQRLFPVDVTIRNLGKSTTDKCSVLFEWGQNQSTRLTFDLQHITSIVASLNSTDIGDALTTGISVKSFIGDKNYDEKIMRLTSEDILESIFSSEFIPAEAESLRTLAGNFIENMNWYSYFTGKNIEHQTEFLTEGTKAILAENWDAFLHIYDENTRELNGFSKEIKKDTLHLIGQSHIDLAWRWRWPETIDVCRRTFQSAINFFGEVPEYKYVQSQAIAFVWMEENYPELFKAIQQEVQAGRFFLTGGMWVEPDLNVPNGESLVRQFLYGKRYFKEKFGVDCVVGYTPDTFGYTWTLPQILSKAGFKYFVTSKIHWNDTTEFPYSIFWWGAPDGSKVLTCFPPTLNFDLDLDKSAQYVKDYEKQNLSDVPLLYGVGDHGGGPTRMHFERAKKMESLAAYPATFHNDLRSYMERIDRKYHDLPEWDNELYLEFHRGTITTQGLIKKRNRRSEVWLEEAEKLSVFSEIDYPQSALEHAWKDALFNQFHDILPGSSIPEVYIDANEMYDHVEDATQTMISSAMQAIAANVNTSGDGVPVLVFNPLSWMRTNLVEISVPDGMEISEIVDSKNNQAIFQQRGDQIHFVAIDVPANGYKTFWLHEGQPKQSKNELKVTETILENSFFKIEINRDNGNIRRMYDKRTNHDVFANEQEGNVLQFFEDLPARYDAWNIGYTGNQWQADTVEKIEIVETGPARAILRYIRTFQNSTFVQDYIIYQDIPRLDIRTKADWQEHHVLLKAAFPVNVQADMATYDIAYGSIQRPTNPITDAEKAKWEVSAHKFVDLSESNFGVSLLNDCKYGHDIVGNMMRITLLRSPLTPDPIELPKDYEAPFADMGKHEFVYSLYPHSGNYQQAFSYHKAYNINYPLIPQLTESHKGKLPAEQSFVTLVPDNLVLTVIKKAEDSNSTIFRGYEIHGKSAEAKLKFNRTIKNAWVTNLLEERQNQLKIQKNSVTFKVKPFEIFTVEIE
ncbi:alpha-mannosidase [candidate division KSB1 bacterium]|nr:alpha-mannosidase [candidate division KSB1 bacterium]